MDTVFLTGAGGEPAQSIARRLVTAGYRVYGFAAQFPAEGFRHPDFKLVPVNLADPAAVRAEVTSILAEETTPAAVILAGNYPVEENFEATHAEDIALALNAAVVGPLTLARTLLPGLVRRRGSVIAITKTAGENPGCALAATVAGALNGFTRALFAELRDTGVKTARIKLENNAGAPDPALRFTNTPQSQVQPDIVADTVETILRLRENNAITELVLRPQATREEPRLPVSAEPRLRTIQVVQLPPQSNFPPPRETIYTPERKRPDYAPPPDEEEDEMFEDDDGDVVDPELAYLIKPQHRQQNRPQPEQQRRDNRQENRQPQRPPRSGAMRIHAPGAEEIASQQTPQHRQNQRDDRRNDNNRRQDDRRDNRQNDRRQQPPPAQNQNNGNAPQHSPYPQNWHWPRPPSPQQLERIARRNAQQGTPPPRPPDAPVANETPAPAVREFIPPPPRETKSEAPEFIPPISAAGTPAPEFKPQADVKPAEAPAEEMPVKPAKKKAPVKKKSGDEPAEKKTKAAPRKKKETA